MSKHLPRSGEGILWRERRANDEPLPKLETASAIVPSSRRCHATDLLRGDCEMQRTAESVYCYYHDKLQRGMCEPHIDTIIVEVENFSESTGKRQSRSQREFVTRTDAYPVWPLPKRGYVLLAAHERAAA